VAASCARVVYTPVENSIPKMSYSDASRALMALKGNRIFADNHYYNIADVRVSSDSLEITSKKRDFLNRETSETDKQTFRLKSLVVPPVVKEPNGLYYMKFPDRRMFLIEKENDAVACVNALFVLKRYAEGYGPPKDPATEATFQEEARKYRELAVKPALPEEARKYAVQGDFAVEKKNLSVAVDRYAEALKVAPWWPEGHLRRGLILADLDRYGEAMEEMRRFLLLAPEATEARAAQDNIYKWESAGTLTASEGVSRAASATGQASASATDGVMTFTGKIESFPMGPFQFRSGPPLWPSGMIGVAAENGEKRNFLIVGSGTSATIFYDADGTARGNLASGNARVTVGKKVEVKYVSAPANYVTKALAVSVRYLE
jgi:tetratricopeptide (TPR) repeat protein